tara:strand:- start:402 stop:1328 length:927 start_codon:yes stop_codon:yes gene_type:complete
MVILIGASGYIGREFEKQLLELGVETFILSRDEYDYYDLETVRQLLKTRKPKFLINCAGYTGKPNVDACEGQKEETFRGNVTLVRVLAKACRMTGTPWAHISSGCIYQGTKGANGFTEEDTPNFSFDTGNCSHYSGTKARGEEVLLEEGGQYFIWRLRIPFNEYDGPRNYLSKMMNYKMLLDANNSISHKGDFVKYCLALWQTKADFGIYNIVNTDSITTRQVTDKINEVLGLNKEFVFFRNEKHMYDMGFAEVPRSNCILDNTKLRKALSPHDIKVRPAIKAVEYSLKHWITEDIQEENEIPNSFWK